MSSNHIPARISISTGTILRTIACLIAVGVLWIVRDILLSVFVALLLAGALYPLARWAKAHRIPRALALFIAYLILLGAVALLISLLVPAILEQTRALLNTHGGSWSWFSQSIESIKNFLERFGFSSNLTSNLQGLEGNIQQVVGRLFGTITNVFGGIVGFFVVLVLSFYFIIEDSALKDFFRLLVPQEHQEFATTLVTQVTEKLGAWIRGQLVLGLIIGILYFIGFQVIGVPYALLLAVFGGLLEFIPYIGPFISAIPAVILAFTDSPLKALITLIVIIVIQQLENNIIVPKVMQKAIGINPLISVLAFLVGAELFGFVGALFAIPLATAATVGFTEVLRYRRDRLR